MPQSILSNTAIATGGRVINVALGILVTAALTRLLGAAIYGQYALLVAYGSILLVFADLGLYLTLTREIAKHPEQESELLNHIISLRLTAALGVFIIGGIIAVFIPSLQVLATPFFVISAGFVFQSISQLIMGVFQTHAVIWRATVGDIAGRLAQLAIITFAVHSLTPAVAAFVISTGLTLFVHHSLLPNKHRLTLSFNRAKWQRTLATSWPLAALLVINVIYFRTDTVILSLYRSAEEVGFYGLAYRIIESALFIPAMFGGLLLPRLSRGKSARLLEAGLQFMFVVGLVALVNTSFFSFPIIHLIAGSAFRPAAPLLTLLGVALFVMFIGNVFGFALVAFDQQKKLMGIYAVLAAANLIANFLFIPKFGATAAAVSTIATELCATLAAGYLAYKTTSFKLSGVFNPHNYRLLT